MSDTRAWNLLSNVINGGGCFLRVAGSEPNQVWSVASELKDGLLP
jgi:hypothetical protein